MNYTIMSAGPTSVNERVLRASQRPLVNTDLDAGYLEFHRATERKISALLHTNETSFLMLGEAMLGLDGSIASFVEPGDRVLVIYNGIFGEGFVDFVEMYGGVPVRYGTDHRRGIDLAALERFLSRDHDFKMATFVHCETPSGITNDVHGIGQLLNRYGILSVVDAVSGVAGEPFDFDRSKVDVAIGGTQKCLSALTGLTTITLSAHAKKRLFDRKTPVAGFYANFQNYLKRTDGFETPYTQSDTLVNALSEALDIALSHDFVERHARFATITRDRMATLGYELYARDSFANTVTTVLLKDGQTTDSILAQMEKKGYWLSGAMGEIAGKAFRIGHMGNNIADEKKYMAMLDALEEVLTGV